MLGEKTVLGRLFFKIYAVPELPTGYNFVDWARRAKLRISDEILDVGCGLGQTLLLMYHEGFSNLMGIDPFIDEDILYPNGVRILKKKLSEMGTQFDFIMLNHSFEHMPDPLDTLMCLRRILRPSRLVLLRMPVVPSYTWQEYTTHWMGLDPPRHLFVHSIKSLELLAEKAGFRIEEIVFEAEALLFLGSEQIAKGIPMLDDRSIFKTGLENSIFSHKDILRYQEETKQACARGEGDLAAFYLRKI
jgi:SAM-dependent methyltransferase